MMLAPLICTLFLVLKRWVLLPPWKKRVEFNLNFFRVSTWEKARFHKINQKKKLGAYPDKNLGGCYPILFQVHALQNLRWHPQIRLKGWNAQKKYFPNFMFLLWIHMGSLLRWCLNWKLYINPTLINYKTF